MINYIVYDANIEIKIYIASDIYKKVNIGVLFLLYLYVSVFLAVFNIL